MGYLEVLFVNEVQVMKIEIRKCFLLQIDMIEMVSCSVELKDLFKVVCIYIYLFIFIFSFYLILVKILLRCYEQIISLFLIVLILFEILLEKLRNRIFFVNVQVDFIILRFFVI